MPAIIGRPDERSGAASNLTRGIIREPLTGVEGAWPVE